VRPAKASSGRSATLGTPYPAIRQSPAPRPDIPEFSARNTVTERPEGPGVFTEMPVSRDERARVQASTRRNRNVNALRARVEKSTLLHRYMSPAIWTVLPPSSVAENDLSHCVEVAYVAFQRVEIYKSGNLS
jgi:hypothetical protein